MRSGKRFYVAAPAVTWRPNESSFRYDPDRLRVVVSAGPAPRVFCRASDAAVRAALTRLDDVLPEFRNVTVATEKMRPPWRGLCLYLAAAAAFKSVANVVPMEVRDWSAIGTRRGYTVPAGVAELLKLLELGWNVAPENMAFIREHYGASVADRYEEIRDGAGGSALTALLGLDVKTDVLDVVLRTENPAERASDVLETLGTDCVVDLGRNGLELTALSMKLKNAEFDELRNETGGVYLEMDLAEDAWRVGSSTTGFRSEPYPMSVPAPQAERDEMRSQSDEPQTEREETPQETECVAEEMEEAEIAPAI